MGAPIAAAPPPGLWFASTVFYIPMASGNGNADCGPGCKERYNAVGATVNLTCGTGWNLTVSALYDINTASEGRTGLYQVIARNPATAPAFAALLTGPANPGRGYTSGNYLYVDWTATKKFGSWEVGPVGFFKFQTTDDSPGGINPATSPASTCAQLTAARLPRCV